LRLNLRLHRLRLLNGGRRLRLLLQLLLGLWLLRRWLLLVLLRR